MWHPDEGTIHAWLDAAVSADESAELEAHVARCPACADAVAEARGLIAASSGIVASLDHVRGGVIPARPAPIEQSLWRRMRLSPSRAAIAASLIVGIGAMFAVNHRDPSAVMSARQIAGPDLPVQTAAPVAAAAAPAVHPVVPAAEPAAPSRKVVRTLALSPTDTTAKPSEKPSVAAIDVAAAPAPVPAPAAPAAQAKVAAQVTQMQPAVSTNLAAGARAFRAVNAPALASLEGCFRVTNDSANWLRNIPQAFALQQAEGSGGPVVRAVTDGRIDSIVPGVGWRGVGNMVLVEFRGPGAPAVTLRFAPNDTRGRLQSGDLGKAVAVERTACRP